MGFLLGTLIFGYPNINIHKPYVFWLQESWSVSISQGKKALERLCREAYGGHPSQDQCAANCLGFRDPVLSSGSVFLAKKVTDR